MKTYGIYTFIALVFLAFTSCKTSNEVSDNKISFIVDNDGNTQNLTLTFIKGEGFNHPTFAVWIEDMEGNYIRTLYVTRFFASGKFGHEMVGDSVWKKTSGPSFQPAALPYWVHKKGLIDGKVLIPTMEHPFVDAYTGATPNSDFEIKSTYSNHKKYRVLLEVNQAWDWNKYWTNNKYPGNKAYLHSAQPSVIYAVEINDDNNVFYMNPIGYGSPTGEDGKLYTNLQTLTSAKQIYKTIKIETINN
jgi:hypothetical protein